MPYQNKPDPNKNFIENYKDHVLCLTKKFDDRWEQGLTATGCKLLERKSLRFNFFRETRGMPRSFRGFNREHLIADEVLSHWTLFQPLRDGHDYVDELMGATVVPALFCPLAVYQAGYSFMTGLAFLMVQSGLMHDYYQSYGTKAINDLFTAGIFFLGAGASLAKSTISLVTRPMATALLGFEASDIERFDTGMSL